MGCICLLTAHILFLSYTHNVFQFAYGLGTARYKSAPTAEPDEEIIKLTVMAVKNGYYHLDGAEGIMLYVLT